MTAAVFPGGVRDPEIGAAVGSMVPVPSDAQTAWLRIFGADTVVFYSLDRDEHARRLAAGTGPLARMRDLEMLMRLPAGMPVRLSGLEAGIRAGIEDLPAGVVQCAGTHVVRHAVRPLRLHLAVVRARSPRSGLVSAGRFAPFSQRAILLDRPAAPDGFLAMEAAFYGVGVIVRDGDALRMPVAPEPHAPARHTAAGWQFVERLYQRLTAGLEGAVSAEGLAR